MPDHYCATQDELGSIVLLIGLVLLSLAREPADFRTCEVTRDSLR